MTIEDCAVEFKRLYPETEDRDLVASYTAEAETWEEAVDRACRSRGANGKMYNHQSRVPLNTLLEFRNKIGDWSSDYVIADWLAHVEMYGDDKHGEEFDALHDGIERIASTLPGIGPVTTYDVAWRLACWLKITPQSLYLHAGVREGAKAAGLRVRGRDRILKAELQRELGMKTLRALGDVNSLEDFLCCFRRVFGQLPFHPDIEEYDEFWEEADWDG